MRHAYTVLCLWLLVVAAQHGAVVHELGHVSGAIGAELHGDLTAVSEKACASCPSFAEVVTPSLSMSLDLPRLGRALAERAAEPLASAVSAAVPRPRSRGPPATI